MGQIDHQEGGQELCEGPPKAPCLAQLHTGGRHRRAHAFLCISPCQVDPEELTLICNLRKLMKNDWVSVTNNIWPWTRWSLTQLLKFHYFVYKGWRCHHHHSVSDRVSLHFQRWIFTPGVAERGQESFQYRFTMNYLCLFTWLPKQIIFITFSNEFAHISRQYCTAGVWWISLCLDEAFCSLCSRIASSIIGSVKFDSSLLSAVETSSILWCVSPVPILSTSLLLSVGLWGYI